MFTMMNEARLGVGVQGLALSEVAYQNAAIYARERLQGRAISGTKYPDKPADPIIVHPDVRRTLMTIRAFNEAARALVMWTALKSDIAHRSDNEKDRKSADDHMGLLTPVIKGVLTDSGFANAVMAQQVYGGHGYIAEHGMEQFVRDARIAQIYEGANGIQALDLVGRKLGKDGGRALMAFFKEVQGYIKDKSADEAMKGYVTPLGLSLDHLQQASMWFMQNAMAKPDNAGAGATEAQLHDHAQRTIGERPAWPKQIHIVEAIPLTSVGKIYKPQLRCDAATRLVTRIVHEQLALPQAHVQVSEGGRRGMRVAVTLPEAARLAVPVVEQALAAYLFEALVTVQ